jgi:hypothetical protein
MKNVSCVQCGTTIYVRDPWDGMEYENNGWLLIDDGGTGTRLYCPMCKTIHEGGEMKIEMDLTPDATKGPDRFPTPEQLWTAQRNSYTLLDIVTLLGKNNEEIQSLTTMRIQKRDREGPLRDSELAMVRVELKVREAFARDLEDMAAQKLQHEFKTFERYWYSRKQE